MSQGRALFVTAFAPVLGSGRALRTYTVVRALVELGPLDLAYVPHGADEPSSEYQAIDGVAFHPIAPSRGARRALAFGRARAAGWPKQYARGVSPELIEVAERLGTAPGRGRVIAGELNAMTAMLGLARRRPVVYNAHNVESALVHEGRGRLPWSRAALWAIERRSLARAAESWMVSAADVARARRVLPSARLRYVPNVVDVGAIVPVGERPPAGDAGRVLMLGDFTYAPNRSGLAMLAGEVMPRVWERAPGVRLRVAGRGLDPAAFPDPRIEVAGFVPDLATAYADVDAVAVPLVQSGGTPLKLVEALAYGIPVVATPLAASGLELVPGEHYLAGPDPEAFAGALLRVVREGAPGLGARARELAEREYSVETLVRLLGE